MTDLEIAAKVQPEKIENIAAKLGLSEENLEMYGRYKAKLSGVKINPRGKLVLVTALTPTSAGEGKTTVSIGLADGFAENGKSVCFALREPSLGPVFGLKGGATGGGYSQVIPMEDINLHFTGDFHAITAANNLLSAMLDNHIHQGNERNIDIESISFHRCMDMNDRALRNITCGVGGGKNGVTRNDNFDITAASEIMAVLCLAEDMNDLKNRLGDITVAKDTAGKPVTARDVGAEGAMAVLLKDAIKPNLVQTLIGTPAIIHGGPFANIAHGCNSVIATKTAMSLADYTVTEAGFGADLGAEKFIDVKCREAGLKPNAVVLVATVRALKLHGGADKNNLKDEDTEAVRRGLPNLLKHIESIKDVYKTPVVVAINKFATDTDAELEIVEAAAADKGVKAIVANVWGEGGIGATELAREVERLCEKNYSLEFSYGLDETIEEKITHVAQKIYGADGVDFTDEARKDVRFIEACGKANFPVIIAKTQYSLSDNKALLCRPTGFRLTIRRLQLRTGARFIVALAGDMMLMPGLGKVPAAANMDIDENLKITGLF